MPTGAAAVEVAPATDALLADWDRLVEHCAALPAPAPLTRAVSVGNPREFLQAEKEDQEMAEACKRLIKNCIICWNYLYLSQKLLAAPQPARRV